MSRQIFWASSLILTLSMIPSNTAQALDSKSALLVWWTLDEGKGTLAVDHSGNGYDGTFVGAPQWVTGYTGSALGFDGVDDYAVFNFPAAESFNGVTVALWLKCAKLGQVNYAAAFASHYPNTAGFQLDVDGGNPGQYRVNPSGLIFGPAATDWVHLTLVAEGTAARLYYNGVPTATGSLNDNRWDEFCLGVNRNRAIWWAGACDDLRVYNRPMEAGQVQGLLNGIVPDFAKATTPSPGPGAAAVDTPFFTWKPGDGAVLHDVYLGTSPELTEADRVAKRQPVTLYFHVPGLTPGVTYYWRVDEIEADGTTTHAGDVWSFTAQGLTAYQPSPADGAKDAAPAPILTWLPGRLAAKHHVYLSDSRDAVQQRAASADKGEAKDPTFTPGVLTEVTTYYWAVDELVVTGEVKAGPVWTFTTCLPVDDFESYTDAEGSRIYEAWADGLTNGTGSLVGYMTSPFAEQKIVHGGKQSMPLDYNNIKSPFYSEAEQEFATAQDWTVGEVSTLVLFVRGKLGNGPAPLYLTVKDAANKTATVVHPDATVIGAAKWSEWRIPLSSLTGVNLAKIKKITLGLGDKANPKAGGAGLIYIDDIRLIRS